MITLVVIGPSYKEAEDQIVQGNLKGNCLEFRLDMFDFSESAKIQNLLHKAVLPVIFTFRKSSHGGNSNLSDSARQQTLLRLALLKPDYVDVEYDEPVSFFERVKKLDPGIKIICSYHNFEDTPQDLNAILNGMRNPYVSIYKIAAMAKSTLDALRMLNLLKANRDTKVKLIGISMGERGQPSRILGKIFGSIMAYSTLDISESSAPGQLDADTLKDLYHYEKLNKQTMIFGLIGAPVDKSIGHIVNNHVFRDLGLDAVYVKMHISREEVAEFLSYARELGFAGLSVTMPLKEEVAKAVTELDPASEQIGAINTLLFSGRILSGKNTDSGGALDAIEERGLVKGKRVVVIGAGGAAKAIAYEALQRGAKVCILNRTVNRAKEIAEKMGCEWGGFEDYPQVAKKGYDIIINATSVGFEKDDELPFAENLLPDALVMDVVSKPRNTPFLLTAQSKGCKLVFGIEMFILQAVKQYEFWLGDSIDRENVKNLLEDKLSQIKI
jgi:3-dehydroquinate dehydratase/shikimate dehydrogenase